MFSYNNSTSPLTLNWFNSFDYCMMFSGVSSCSPSNSKAFLQSEHACVLLILKRYFNIQGSGGTSLQSAHTNVVLGE